LDPGADAPLSTVACLGIGVVRGVDPRSGLLYVTTTMSEAVMARVDVLLAAEPALAALPTVLLHSAFPPASTPYLNALTGKSRGAGGATMKSRTNIGRVSHNSNSNK
jgi:hypothetical protein